MLKINIHQDFDWGKNILDCSKTCFPIFSPIIFWKNSENSPQENLMAIASIKRLLANKCLSCKNLGF